MLGHFNLLHAHAPAGLRGGEGSSPFPGVGREGFTADAGQHAELDQALRGEGLEGGQFGVIRGYQGGVVEGFVQPRAQRQQLAPRSRAKPCSARSVSIVAPSGGAFSGSTPSSRISDQAAPR